MVAQTADIVERPGIRALGVDIFKPADQEKKTAIIVLHGGGWMGGERGMVYPHCQELAKLGFTAIAAEYRLLDEAVWPAQLIDVKAVIGWVRENAEKLGVDPSRIAIGGFSAGGHLALLAASAPETGIAGVFACFAPTALKITPESAGPNPIMMLLAQNPTPEGARAASPASYVHKGFPPVFLAGGTSDPLTRPADILEFYHLLAAAGVPTDLHFFHSQTHEFTALPSMLAPVQALIGQFLDRSVVNPEFYAKENLELNPFASFTLPE